MASTQDNQTTSHYPELIARIHALEELLAVSEQAFLEEAQRLEKAKDKAEDMSRQLAAKVRELENLNRMTEGRELKMIELKKQLKEICAKYGEKPPY